MSYLTDEFIDALLLEEGQKPWMVTIIFGEDDVMDVQWQVHAVWSGLMKLETRLKQRELTKQESKDVLQKCIFDHTRLDEEAAKRWPEDKATFSINGPRGSMA